MKWLRENKAVLWAAAALIAAVLCLALGGEKTGGASQEEKRIAQVLSAIEGAGRVEVALYYTKEQESALGGLQSARPTGAVVVAQGAEKLEVRLSLIRAVRTLLGLPEAAVDVFVMEEGGR
ncbi:MAG: hypothetical protein MR842_03960 [Clostridiales bacterium]|nr:hypothetical protein [Clostridiales bacterium]MDO4351259.1 hypothetical protein [Eubacteriales bacterium]MDY4009467.1 hypothetical protein [Candidatus Limiplasma sp.]